MAGLLTHYEAAKTGAADKKIKLGDFVLGALPGEGLNDEQEAGVLNILSNWGVDTSGDFDDALRRFADKFNQAFAGKTQGLEAQWSLNYRFGMEIYAEALRLQREVEEQRTGLGARVETKALQRTVKVAAESRLEVDSSKLEAFMADPERFLKGVKGYDLYVLRTDGSHLENKAGAEVAPASLLKLLVAQQYAKTFLEQPEELPQIKLGYNESTNTLHITAPFVFATKADVATIKQQVEDFKRDKDVQQVVFHDPGLTVIPGTTPRDPEAPYGEYSRFHVPMASLMLDYNTGLTGMKPQAEAKYKQRLETLFGSETEISESAFPVDFDMTGSVELEPDVEALIQAALDSSKAEPGGFESIAGNYNNSVTNFMLVQLYLNAHPDVSHLEPELLISASRWLGQNLGLEQLQEFSGISSLCAARSIASCVNQQPVHVSSAQLAEALKTLPESVLPRYGEYDMAALKGGVVPGKSGGIGSMGLKHQAFVDQEGNVYVFQLKGASGKAATELLNQALERIKA